MSPKVFFSRWLLLPVLAMVLGGCAKKEDPASVTRRFFEQIAAGKTSEAYQGASFSFRARQPERVFEQRIKETGLDSYTSAKWEPVEIEGSEAKMRGEVSGRNDKKIPMRITLVEESGVWRIYSLRWAGSESGTGSQDLFSLVGKGSSFSDPLNRPAPSDAEVKELVRESLLRFNTAVQEESFAGFFAYVAQAWQRQITVGQLQRAFQSFLDKKVDLTDAAKAEIILAGEPAVNTEGLLLVNGHYPNGETEVYFALKYLYELPRWRLFGIELALKPAAKPTTP